VISLLACREKKLDKRSALPDDWPVDRRKAGGIISDVPVFVPVFR
jgi:hypothetical protein